ncbi:substrate-binding domain-containing protein [Streptomyces sp. NBC_01381]|uniref:substrate-binding domain-containing protein n=1 Tax=Streptomyces sp. NBC_01381 TaxID=2903845 RepID=UPI002B1E4754|nr:substrate-binding domain-containing protein [Streptomyces sp. NBC_01381]
MGCGTAGSRRCGSRRGSRRVARAPVDADGRDAVARVAYRKEGARPPGHGPAAHAYHWRDGARAAAALMDRRPRPDVLLCLNDHLALGALRALYERGSAVPGDLDVVGFDDIETSRFSVPSLTTVAPDKREIARVAVSLLLERVEGADGGPPRDHLVGHRLMVRESTGG